MHCFAILTVNLFSFQTLHLYLEATTEVCLVKLVFGGKLIDRDHKPLSNYGVDGNCCIMVEEVIVEV